MRNAVPSFTRALIAANVLVFVLQLAVGNRFVEWFALWPPVGDDWANSSLLAPWQWLSYAFLHGGMMHLAFNMFGLWMFGGALEQAWGARRVALAYFASVFFGAAAQICAVALLGSGGAPVVGASAGVFGLMLAYALMFPESRIMMLIPPIPLPARVFVLLYAILELTLGVTSSQAGVAHFAHLGGLIGGWLVYKFGRA
jgi:membrane associated rhomboid family serine protease